MATGRHEFWVPRRKRGNLAPRWIALKLTNTRKAASPERKRDPAIPRPMDIGTLLDLARKVASEGFGPRQVSLQARLDEQTMHAG